ncbi:MAG: DNA polymerase III subunit alpha [Deltaproteobacteria bacterium]|nr:DNA polymerase III subunit alpha [Deltaproteobacteria bacterium]
MEIVHLNVHSHYSKGWGMGTIDDLLRTARELGLDRLALTDTNGLYGMVEFIQKAREMGIRPLVGSEVVADGRRAVVLVKTQAGYARLCRILSARHCDAGFDLVQTLAKMREGLIVFSDDLSLLKTLKRDSIKDLYVEMSPGYQMGRCYAFSRKSGIPPLATRRVYLLDEHQFPLHRILRAVSLNTKLSRLRQEDTCRSHDVLTPPARMIDQYPHAPAALRNTVRVAEAALADWDFNQTIFPRFEDMDDQAAFDLLYQKTLAGCRSRYGSISRAVRERVDHEMRIIRDKNFAHYFLVVDHITKKARRSCGRGSAAASIVAYALGITHVDPIKHRLFFERFLNPQRMDPPDIDIDFAWDERDRIIDALFAAYGNRRAAMVANHNGFGARAAIRAVAKVFGLTDQEIGQVTDKIGFRHTLGPDGRGVIRHPEMRDVPFNKPWDEILFAAARLERHFNHLSTHCGGVVMVPDDIRRHCPVEISNKGLQVLQWEKDAVEASGLVKIDILGNRSLAVIRDALEQVEKNYALRIDYADLNPLDDPETVRIFYKGDTFGIFYFESPATRQVLTQVASAFSFGEYLKQDHFSLNVVVTSIIRPASNPHIHDWISRLRGAPWKPLHPLLEPVLKETLGIMVFQEQLSQAAIYLAGFDPAEADTLRKTVSKKDREKRLKDFHARFVRGADAKGVSRKVIDAVWEMMMGFDGYSFCKPHSASYTLVAYKSAYLRARYPAEFMAGVLSNGGGYYSTLSYISEARRMGLRVLPPHINESENHYTGKGGRIRMGFMQLKGLSQEAKEAIIHERNRNGPFDSFQAFLERTGPHLHLKDVKVLIKGGCFDPLHGVPRRAELMWEGMAFFDGRDTTRPAGLFDQTVSPCPRPAAHTSSYPRSLLLKQEMESFGFVLSVHPLALYGHVLKTIPHVRAADLGDHIGKRVTTVGRRVTGKRVRTKTGDPMTFITFEDVSGTYETVFFPEVYHKFCHLLNTIRPYVLKGSVGMTFNAITLTVEEVEVLGVRL